MSDDERLAALFRDAAADAPPPAFGHDDVLAASRRITARRRSAAVVVASVIGLAGIGAAIVLPGSDRGELTSAAAPAAAPLSAPEAGNRAADKAGDAAGDSGSGESAAVPAAPPAFGTAPLGPGAGECADRQDPALRALVEQVLPEVAAATPAVTTEVCSPGSHRYLSLDVGGGVLSVSYLPPGTVPSVVAGTLSRSTASGGTVIVVSTPATAGAPAPFADRLPQVLAFLAPRL